MNERLKRLAQRVDALGETVTMAKDPVDGSTIAVLGWEELERLLDNLSTLDGATSQPEPYTQPKTAGEFAALWNAKSPEDREKLMAILLDQQERARKCFMEDHDGLKEALRGSEQAHLMSEQKLASIQRAVLEFGIQQGVVHPEPESWTTKQSHPDCTYCEAAVENAINDAQTKNLPRSHWIISMPATSSSRLLEIKHIGRVERS